MKKQEQETEENEGEMREQTLQGYQGGVRNIEWKHKDTKTENL